jgi:hypothetical protein
MELYDIYQELLTEKQKSYFEASFFDDSSMGEIADEFSISRNAVHDQLKKTITKLQDLENALHIRENNIRLSNLLFEIKEKAKELDIINLINDFEKVE